MICQSRCRGFRLSVSLCFSGQAYTMAGCDEMCVCAHACCISFSIHVYRRGYHFFRKLCVTVVRNNPYTLKVLRKSIPIGLTYSSDLMWNNNIWVSKRLFEQSLSPVEPRRADTKYSLRISSFSRNCNGQLLPSPNNGLIYQTARHKDKKPND